MKDDKNVIAEKSELYQKLLKAYQIEDLGERFNKCYKLVDKAKYKEIHFVITCLKQNAAVDIPKISIEPINVFLESFFTGIAGSVMVRSTFLLDILEEARERKRK